MALTPETAGALKDALDAVIQQCGDDPQYADLIDSLKAAEQAIPSGEGHAAHGDHAAPAHGAEPTDPHGADDHGATDTQSADDMFAAAEAAHKARRKPQPPQHGGKA
jgi:hypothetical protein